MKTLRTIEVTITSCGDTETMTVGPDRNGRSIELEDRFDKHEEGYHSISLMQGQNQDLIREHIEYFDNDKARPKHALQFVSGYCRIWNSMLKKKAVSEKEFARLWESTKNKIDKTENARTSYCEASDDEFGEIFIPF